MVLSPVPGVINRGVILNGPTALPATTEMLVLDASGNITTQSIPVASFGALTGSPSDNAALSSALAAKVNLAGDTMTGKLRVPAGDYFNAGLEVGSLVGMYDSSGLVVRYNGQECLQLNQSELSLRSSQEIGWTGTTSATGAIDSKFVRNNVGQVDFRGDSGFRVRNLANSAFTNITAASFVSDSLTITGGSPSNIVSSNRITFTGSAPYIFYKSGNSFTLDPSGSGAATFGGALTASNGTFSGNVALSSQANQLRIGTIGGSGPGVAIGCGVNGSVDVFTYAGQNHVASFLSTNAVSPGLCFRNGHGVYFSSAATPDPNAWDAAVLRSTNVVVTAADSGLNVMNKAQSARATLRASVGDFNNSVVISAPAITGRETILRASVTDSGNDAFHIYNATSISNSFAPGFSGSRFSSSLSAMGFIAQTNAANDTGSEPLMLFEARRTDSTTDPNNGTLSAITTRPLFRWQTFGVNHMLMFANGNLALNSSSDSGDKLQVAGSGLITGQLTHGFQTLVANPSTVDITTGLSRMVKNSTSGELRLWANDGGSMKSILLS